MRHSIRPGLSGLWQVMARSDADIAVQESYDRYYIQNWSIWLDIFIILKTVESVLVGRGAR
jgi:lipopolysaccharide/colanic/teichoic acid biosynthesis glycosyltransferase